MRPISAGTGSMFVLLSVLITSQFLHQCQAALKNILSKGTVKYGSPVRITCSAETFPIKNGDKSNISRMAEITLYRKTAADEARKVMLYFDFWVLNDNKTEDKHGVTTKADNLGWEYEYADSSYFYDSKRISHPDYAMVHALKHRVNCQDIGNYTCSGYVFLHPRSLRKTEKTETLNVESCRGSTFNGTERQNEEVEVEGRTNFVAPGSDPPTEPILNMSGLSQGRPLTQGSYRVNVICLGILCLTSNTMWGFDG